MIIIVTYDLRTPKDYHDFFEAIKAQADQGKWWHYMASTWLLATTKSPQLIADALHPHMDSQDLLFVCEVTPNYQGYLPKPAWDWLNTELPTHGNFYNALLAAGLSQPGRQVVPGGIPPPPTAANTFSVLAEALGKEKESGKP